MSRQRRHTNLYHCEEDSRYTQPPSVTFFDENRDGKEVQVGHRFNVQFKLPIVDDKVVYEDGSSKTKGYNIVDGVNNLETDELRISKGGRQKRKLKGVNKLLHTNLFSNR